MLYVVKKLSGLVIFCCIVFAANASPKPDLQKVYNEAINWSKTKLEKAPEEFGGCRGAEAGEPLPIKPPCTKKLDTVLDDVTNPENRRNVHGDILSGSTKPPVYKLLVFVSFSMPKTSLKALAESAHKHNAKLVMQGLKDDSFKTTQAAFHELIDHGSQENAQGFEVNPELFKTYKITKVPVFVLIKDGKEISRLSGNVSLNFAAQKLQESA